MGNLDNYQFTFEFPVGPYVDEGQRFRDWTLYDVFSEGLYTPPNVCIVLTAEPRHARRGLQGSNRSASSR